MRLPISLVVITLNEEEHIADCITSVPFAKEIVVVDSGSADQTVDIAKSLGAHVITNKFQGYRQQKQFALDNCTQPWVISLDADERLSPELQDEIIKTFAYPSEMVDGYWMTRISFHLGRWIRHGGWYPDWQLRLFKKKNAKWAGGNVHEHVEVQGTKKRLKSSIQHFVFKNLDDQIDANNRYSTEGARDLQAKGVRFRVWRLVLRPFGKFFECYVWKLGFLDGAAGFIIALGAAQSLFLKYAKLWELEKTKN